MSAEPDTSSFESHLKGHLRRERERERVRERDRARESERETEPESQRERDRARESERERETHTHGSKRASPEEDGAKKSKPCERERRARGLSAKRPGATRRRCGRRTCQPAVIVCVCARALAEVDVFSLFFFLGGGANFPHLRVTRARRVLFTSTQSSTRSPVAAIHRHGVLSLADVKSRSPSRL